MSQHTDTPTVRDAHPGRRPDRQRNDNRRLSANRRRKVVENDEYAAFTRRIVRAYSRRVAAGDIEALAAMVTLAADVETAIRDAVIGLRAFGYSWMGTASRLGISRQAACRAGTPAPTTPADPPRGVPPCGMDLVQP
jgi:hypothetical protein